MQNVLLRNYRNREGTGEGVLRESFYSFSGLPLKDSRPRVSLPKPCICKSLPFRSLRSEVRHVHCPGSLEGEFHMKIIKNAIRCNLCGDVIESCSRHDFVRCKCGACAVDGGHDYLRRLAPDKASYTELSVVEKEEHPEN